MLVKGYFIFSFLSLQDFLSHPQSQWMNLGHVSLKSKNKNRSNVMTASVNCCFLINPPVHIYILIFCFLPCYSLCYLWARNPNISLRFQQSSSLPPAPLIFTALLWCSKPTYAVEFLPSKHNLSWSYIPLQLLSHVCFFRVKFFERVFTCTISNVSLHFPSQTYFNQTFAPITLKKLLISRILVTSVLLNPMVSS